MGDTANDTPHGDTGAVPDPGAVSASGAEQPKAWVDVEDPAAGKGGVVLDPSLRFKPGVSGNPSGRPKGSHSARTALQRKWRKGWQDDAEAESDDERVGAEARRVAAEIHAAALMGDAEKVRALATLIDQAEGRPQERIEHSGSTARTLIVFPGEDSDAPAPALPEGEG